MDSSSLHSIFLLYVPNFSVLYVTASVVLLFITVLHHGLLTDSFPAKPLMQKRMLSSYDTDSDKSKLVNICSKSLTNKSESAVLSA